MLLAQKAADEAIAQLERARQQIARKKSRQVTAADELDYVRSVAYAWFNTHRQTIYDRASHVELDAIDYSYKTLLQTTGKAASRKTYVDGLKLARQCLIEARAELLVASTPAAKSEETVPDFSFLASDTDMQSVLVRRWKETQKCLKADAHLAATVMMGGLLEALFVARANRLEDKSPLFKAKTTPIDGKTKKPVPLSEWTLRPYIDVGHELGWITRSGKDVAAILRDYRNYVHPEKERAHAIVLGSDDSSMFWEVTKSLARQLLHGAQS
jgi:hypothetical protein